MQRGNNKKDIMSCTAPALASRTKLSFINIPSELNNALKNIYCLTQKSICPSNLKDQILCSDYIRCIESLSNIQTIIKQDYLIILKICLYIIQFEQDLEMDRYRLSNYTIKSADSKDCFIIDMKSLNRDVYTIRPGCDVTFRDIVTRKVIFGEVTEVLDNSVAVKVFPRNVFRVFKERRFDIRFYDHHWTLRCCHYALKMISRCNWIDIVYPQLKTDYIDMKINVEWINTNMTENEQQQQAVRKILNKTACPAPYIIFGPPGTGKTATLVETICQIVRHFPTKNILVCTVSNAAADEITKRLIKNVPTNLIYRMYAPSREWSAVDKEIRPCANFVEETTIFLSKELLLLKKIIITTLISSIRLIDVNFRENHFSYIIIDEASQAIEPEMLIPFTITSKTRDEGIGFGQAQIVIAGDPHQLGPVVRCKRIEHLLGKSMLERLMSNCDPYKKQDEKYNPNYITKLIKNYRSHKSLLHVSNKLFYNNELEICGGACTQTALGWSHLPNKNFPMIFQEILGTEKRCTTQSVYNMAEVLAVLTYIDMLINTKFGKHVITSKDIGIITPFKQQQLNISHFLAAMKLKDITVGTVESFQGQERNVMILSTVRSKIFEHNGKEHIGFLSNRKRFNVAVTRAKALMIIIGNPDILCEDKYWKVLLKYCKKHDAYIPFKQMPLTKDIITKVKSNFNVKSRNDSSASNITKSSVTVTLPGEERETLFNALVCKMENKLK